MTPFQIVFQKPRALDVLAARLAEYALTAVRKASVKDSRGFSEVAGPKGDSEGACFCMKEGLDDGLWVFYSSEED